MACNVKHVGPPPQSQFFPFKGLSLAQILFAGLERSGFVVMLLFLTACSVGLTFLIEGHECFLKFGICVRPLAHISDANKEERAREREGGGVE